jgi:TolA-binding protein
VPELLTPVVEAKEVDAKLKAAAQFRLAWTLAKTDKQLAAAEAFKAFVDQYGDHERAPAALYQAGVNFAAGGKNEDANKAFAALIDRDSKSELGAVALIKRGQVLAELGDYQESAKMYERYLKEHEKGDYRYLAEFGIGWAHEQRKKYDDARQWYSRVIEDHNGETAARAQFQIGQAYFAEKKFEPALKELLKVDIIYQAPRWASLALYEAGRVAEAMNKPDDARQYYTQVSTKFPDSNAAAMAKKRLTALGGALGARDM